ncbi:hypothetical protein NSQ85_01355 [Streptococcus sp. FSL L8-0526]|nr:hypothetical protein [Streptococcus thermophilus]
MSLFLFSFLLYNRVIARKLSGRRSLSFLKGRFNCLPELSLLIVILAYNIIRIMNDLGSIKVPSWFLDMDIPNGCLLLLILLIVLKSDERE